MRVDGLCTHPPANLGVTITNKAQAKLHPIRDNHSEDVQRELARDEGTSRRVCCDLSRPYWYYGVQTASANTVDDTRAEHPKTAVRSFLEQKRMSGTYHAMFCAEH